MRCFLKCALMVSLTVGIYALAEARDWPGFSCGMGMDDDTREFLSPELLKACLGK